jgi:hypothetical protein
VIQNLGSTLAHNGQALDVNATRAPPQGQDDVPQDPQPASLKTKDWGLPVMFRVGMAFDMLNAASSRVTLLGEFSQPTNTKASWAGGLEWAYNVGTTGVGLAARGSYAYQPDASLEPDAQAAGFTTSLSRGSDGMALGGGLFYHRPGGGFGLGLDYAYRSLGILGGTHFYSVTLNW